ncbi:UNVERIFIED_CONTAM: hypothetical protein Scaly_0971200 [Sesamum calycinum]|uniref:Glutaredoxin domain-containing protein n=1 Tax=Sesamum calycinum TaxID=2727403 RepID=A0AAW2QZZ5_9LAMI
MGCTSSTLLNQDEEFSQTGGSASFSHHIVSLTSTTYGLLTLDPPTLNRIQPRSPPQPPPRLRLLRRGSLWGLCFPVRSPNRVLFRFSPSPFATSKPFNPTVNKQDVARQGDEENISPNLGVVQSSIEVRKSSEGSSNRDDFLDGFEMICPPNGENKVVIYTTTLRGVRKTFEDCNAVRLAIEGLGTSFCERDISMDRGFRDELRELMKGKGSNESIPPRVFVKGRYIGGVEETTRIVEEGNLVKLLQGLPKVRGGYLCEGCGGVRFLPCFTCNGSCKVMVDVKEDTEDRSVAVRCSNCNENGLVLCPICS